MGPQRHRRCCKAAVLNTHLVLNLSDVALASPVDIFWDLNEVGLHEQGTSGLLQGVALVAVNLLPELIVQLRVGGKRQRR